MSKDKLLRPFDEVMKSAQHTRVPVITLLTDFGVADGFIGVMKGVMLQIAPQARLIDISHDLPPFSIAGAAFLNQWSYGYFPQGTAHLCVVDPGVGTSRGMLAVQVSGHYFIAPDNGVLSPVLRINEPKTVVSITNKQYWMDKVSHTFHGRDIFSPVAAHLSAGVAIEEMGEINDAPILLPALELTFRDDSISCQIEYTDRFGNLITTLPDYRFHDWMEEKGINYKHLQIQAGDIMIDGISSSYGEKQAGELLAVFDGYNRLEISVNQGNAKIVTGLDYGDSVLLTIKS